MLLMSLLLAATLPAAIPVADCPRLEGTWRSDHDWTMAYLDRNVKMGERQREGVDQMMGRLVVTFDGETASAKMAAWTVALDGEAHRMPGVDERMPYETLHCNDKVVVTRSMTSIAGREHVVVHNFDSADVMWVYVGGADSELPDSSFREYFRRIGPAQPRTD